MVYVKTRLGEGGRFVIPAEIRKALRLQAGDEMLVGLEGREIRLVPRANAVRQAQDLVRCYVAPGRRLADELIAERRAEAARE